MYENCTITDMKVGGMKMLGLTWSIRYKKDICEF